MKAIEYLLINISNDLELGALFHNSEIYLYQRRNEGIDLYVYWISWVDMGLQCYFSLSKMHKTFLQLK